MHQLSTIHYYRDMSDAYWKEEFQHCSNEQVSVGEAHKELLHAMAETPYSQRLEEEYLGENQLLLYKGKYTYSEELEALLEEEVRLQDRPCRSDRLHSPAE